jgi:lipopolysaccharide biosynthesis regulator YciM
LEIYESNAEPDCAEVGLVMFELASIFASVDSFKSAESYFKQSMEVYQANYGENSKEVSKVLEALFKLYAKMNRADLIDYITTLLHSQRGQQQPNVTITQLK